MRVARKSAMLGFSFSPVWARDFFKESARVSASSLSVVPSTRAFLTSSDRETPLVAAVVANFRYRG